MKLLFDFLPIAIFFGIYKWSGDLILATGILIPVTIVHVGINYLMTKRVEKMALITVGLVVVLGGLTVILRDGWFIMWKPTVVNWLFALVFVGSHFIGDKPLIQRMLAQAVRLSPAHWTQLSYAWAIFFGASGVLNLIVAYQFDEATWVNFKLFGLLGLTLVFIILQGIWISRVALPADEKAHEG
ncbi:MAG: septation protein A [Bacteroidetes bacterium]|nr:septation protein A [Bacteroidota bacterium]